MSNSPPGLRGHYSTEDGPAAPIHMQEPEDKTIHIIGLGAIGKLIAHSLRSIPSPPNVVLITHRPKVAIDWGKHRDKNIIIERDGHKLSAKSFKMQLCVPPLRAFGIEIDDPDPIWNNSEGLLPHEAAARLKEKRRETTNSDQLPVPDQPGSTDALEEVMAALDLEREKAAASGRDRDALSEVVDEEDDRLEEAEEEEESEDDKPNAIPPSMRPIDHLIVTTKATLTISALSAVKHRLSAASTICLLQNGMGIADELNEHVFPDPTTRPTYIQGIVSHGVNTPQGSSRWFAVHAGVGTIALCVLPRTTAPGRGEGGADVDITTTPTTSVSSRHMMRTLQRIPILGAIGIPPAEFLQQKLEKLAVNAVINPLTAMLDARNGAVNYSFAMTRVTRLLLAEISLVLRSLPELRGLPNVATRFSAERLETLVVGLAGRTSSNVSSMLADIRAGRQTEARYIGGYIVRRGEELGIATVCNYLMLQLVLGKSKMVQDEARGVYAEGLPGDHPGRG